MGRQMKFEYYPKERFSPKARNYHKFRPRYPQKVIELLKNKINLKYRLTSDVKNFSNSGMNSKVSRSVRRRG